jgi:hypothetical protein
MEVQCVFCNVQTAIKYYLHKLQVSKNNVSVVRRVKTITDLFLALQS